MIIDEWYGWMWRCLHCDNLDGYATPEEIKELEEANVYSNVGCCNARVYVKGERDD